MKKVFVAGPRAVNMLNESINKVLDRMIENNLTVLLGDANGVDRLVQNFFSEKNYNNVIIYASNGKARNNVGHWPVNKVDVPQNIRGFDFYVQKDIKMAQDADNGFMIWNGKSKGTLNNIINLTSQNKKVKIYLIPHRKVLCIESLGDIEKLSGIMGEETLSLYNELFQKPINGFEQLTFFS